MREKPINVSWFAAINRIFHRNGHSNENDCALFRCKKTTDPDNNLPHGCNLKEEGDGHGSYF